MFSQMTELQSFYGSIVLHCVYAQWLDNFLLSIHQYQNLQSIVSGWEKNLRRNNVAYPPKNCFSSMPLLIQNVSGEHKPIIVPKGDLEELNVNFAKVLGFSSIFAYVHL
jgi:hypothetical protein